MVLYGQRSRSFSSAVRAMPVRRPESFASAARIAVLSSVPSLRGSAIHQHSLPGTSSRVTSRRPGGMRILRRRKRYCRHECILILRMSGQLHVLAILRNAIGTVTSVHLDKRHACTHTRCVTDELYFLGIDVGDQPDRLRGIFAQEIAEGPGNVHAFEIFESDAEMPQQDIKAGVDRTLDELELA